MYKKVGIFVDQNTDIEINKDELLKIGEISKICEISVQTLRYYDKVGHIKPIYVDPKTNYRYFSREQLFIIAVTKFLKSRGFSLSDTKDYIKLIGPEKIKDLYKIKKDEINEKLIRVTKLRDNLSNIIKQIKKVEQKHFNYEVKTIKQRTILFSKVKNINNINYQIESFKKFKEIIKKENLNVNGNYLYIYDLNISSKQCTIGISLNETKTDVDYMQISKAKFLCILYHGMQSDYKNHLEKMLLWAKNNNIDASNLVINKCITPLNKKIKDFVALYELQVKIKN